MRRHWAVARVENMGIVLSTPQAGIAANGVVAAVIATHPQRRDECRIAPMPMRHCGNKTPAALAAPAQPGHVGLSPSLHR
jgi:hypothetical protein